MFAKEDSTSARSGCRSSASLDKLHGAMKPTGDKSVLGYDCNESSMVETNSTPQLMFIEHYFSDLPSIYTVVWSKVGGAELVSLSPFDCYQLGDLSRRVGGARRNFSVREFLRQLIREFFTSFELLGATGNLAGQSGASASISPLG
ncbi:WRKY transcription factor 55 [Dorcoceras hygrometricum]|uniref:WRKY transcription factor 55 n=1 Tax=Dorcoceras hygrometricum TaxID=472368 RepID=A0A2Z7B4T8_9LAMI|nr:WRKY transcription factor 55 [Dorcoceras hygrometricum]